MTSYEDVDARLTRISPDAVVSRYAVVGAPGEWVDQETRFPAVIGAGVVVREFARVHAGCLRETVVGEGCLIQSGAYVAHDVRLGPHVTIGTNAVLGGLVEVGEHSVIGAGAVVLPKRRIGHHSAVAPGAVVTHDIPDGQSWAGDPAAPGNPSGEPSGRPDH